MESDFTITCNISNSDPQQCSAKKMLMRPGVLIFNSLERCFTAKIHKTTMLQILPAHLCKVRTKRCPNGKAYIIRYKKVGNIMELALKEIGETDKQLVHSTLLSIVGVRGVKRPLSDCFSTAENKENFRMMDLSNKYDDLERPHHAESLPELFTRPNFWTDLKTDKRLRSGKNGEWVKGQDERLTIDGLLCLCDGQWLNADIIDCHLDRICRRSARTQFIPTYAILSYGRKGTVPSEWYWPLGETDIVLAPAHLYGNHWAIAVLDMRARTLKLMDSLNSGYTSTEKVEFMDKIMSIIRDVAVLQTVDIGDRSEWNVEEQLSVPQQKNGIDCGIFALIFAEYALERREMDFEQCHIPYFRRRICHDLISTILNDQKSPVRSSDGVKVIQCPNDM